ncbi:MAG: 3-phosphoshikimate 1-carboxyvinyltransferase [Acidimicrobiia bacterium]|nr:3-phosphoshikimate 1-carboxyvinyltransferase [Acidimicrobiia bacterium]
MTGVKAVLRRGPVDIAMRPPGSKSLTNRALICAALADGRSTLIGPLSSDDTEAMVSALRALGVAIAIDGAVWHVEGGRLREADHTLDARMSGTTLRFLTAALAVAEGVNVIDGSDRLRQRPIGELVAALRSLGADVEAEGPWGGAPVRVRGPRLTGGRIEMDGRLSSQPVSAVMLVAPYADEDVELRFVDGQVASATYLQTTKEVMAAFGVAADVARTVTVVAHQRYRPTPYEVEADASAAVYPWTAAAITGGRARVTGISVDSTQADLGVLSVLELMGCSVERGVDGIEIVGPNRLEGIGADMSGCPDGALAVAVAAAFADGPTELTGLGTLSVKETDRLTALRTELEKLGVRVRQGADSLWIEPGRLQGATIATYDDHRMAMAFSLAGLAIDGVEIEDPECVTKTWPGFWEEFDTWT